MTHLIAQPGGTFPEWQNIRAQGGRRSGYASPLDHWKTKLIEAIQSGALLEQIYDVEEGYIDAENRVNVKMVFETEEAAEDWKTFALSTPHMISMTVTPIEID